MTNTLLAILERKGLTFCFLSISRMLDDPADRDHILNDVKDPVVIGFWRDYFDGFGNREQQERISRNSQEVNCFE